MKNLVIGLVCALLTISLSGCALQRKSIASKAKASLVGSSKQRILQCMGAAAHMQKEGATEVWKYYSGGDYSGRVDAYTGTASLNKYHCEINIFFRNDHVIKVMYSGRTGGWLTKGEQCAYAVRNCVS